MTETMIDVAGGDTVWAAADGIDGITELGLRMWARAGRTPAVEEQLRSAARCWLGGAVRLARPNPPVFDRLGEIAVPSALLVGDLDQESLIDLAGPVGAEVRARLAQAGDPAGPALADLDGVLAGWAGIENLEERIVPGAVDPLVLAHLRAAG
jgi:hypothetical protein